MSKMTEWVETPATNQRLRIEFVLFFIAVPVLIATLFPPNWMFPSLFAFTGLGILLLQDTPGFSWAELRYGWRNWSWFEVIGFTLFMAAFCSALVLWARPDAAFVMLLHRPEMLIFICIGYPLLSALPQELLFRSLFFRRYYAILPQGRAAYLLNAGLFSLAHLMYWSWVVAIMTFAGGLLFTWAYRKRGSFFYAVLLHAIAGNIIFAAGLGVYFYSGNVQRPF
ncbi:abortive infection protein [Ruegeria sp. ANG-R]|nr:abortive infection protein [Ruegeria sp. ANG-R]